MKRFLCFLLALNATLSVYAGTIGAVSASRGPVIISAPEGSPEAMLLSAFSNPFSEEWIDDYLINSKLFRASYTSYLASILPLENILLFRNDDFYTLYSQKNGITVSVKIEDMLISEIQML